ncbi:sugar phosphate isomerase/epimerase family protein [Thaumasiovibrio subtropicus]|uniref:sugar phosphate isomerase/epimerase family protein n=1 Tax=Thaumasiovibrio subtropicus TaxID=1891207 RepID=UPI000B34BDD9|nr:sugar phosphate isomerase/epimerase [Thaumasiovibrio subtropicus]
MKFGIHLSTLTKQWGDDLFSLMPKVKALGYDGVEFPLMSPETFDIETAKKALEDNGLQCTCGTGLHPEADITSADPQRHANGVQRLKACIDICEQLGSDTLAGVIYAPWGVFTSRQAGAAGIERSLATLRELGDYAAARNVTLAMEILNRYESSFVNTVEEGLMYMARIDHLNVRLHLDTFHSFIEEKDLSAAIHRGGEFIHHVHLCENTRGIPGTGAIDWQGVKAALQAINYDRWLTIENFVMPDCEVGEATFIWRHVETDGWAAAQGGIAFMQQQFSEEQTC